MTTLPPSDPPPGRPWLAPAVASGLALVTLAVLLIPGVLRFPAGGPTAEDPAVLAALLDGNRALEAEIARLQGATQGGVCVFDGAFYPSAVEESAGPPPAESRLDLLAPPPGAARPAPDALPPAEADGAAFDGTIDELLKRSSVLVMNPVQNGLETGTGFFVDPRTIVTNSHVVGDAAEVLVANEATGAPLRARVAARTPLNPDGPQPEADFALLRLDADAPGALPLSFAPPRRTQEVYASGYPGFFVGAEVLAYAQSVAAGRPTTPPQGVVTNGIVTTVQQANGVSYVPHSAGISPGNSGGPLVDLCGRVVGINTFITQSNEDERFVLHGDYALSSADLVAFLQANGVSPRMAAEACTPERVAAPGGAPEPQSGSQSGPQTEPQPEPQQ